MRRIYRTPGRHSGFSLIEVMIAVVVLAIGLLALAALQASLARSSGEAKVRGHVAALLTARMDELRVQQYDSAVTVANDTCAGTVWVPAGFCGEAGIGALTATQTVTPWSTTTGAASFTEGRVPTAGEPQFKRVTLTATWADADNAPHILSMTSDISALVLGSSLLPPPPGSSAGIGGPVVRTDNPAGPGVIPIAIGDGDTTAASNPRPEVIGKQNNESSIGTRFDVLTYRGLTGEAVIQRRVETSVIKCDCRYGAGGTNLPVIYQEAQWPAIWTGERYDVYKPEPVSAAPGASFASGPKANVEQSPLCQECCRDHHDTATPNIPKFDPERVVTLKQAHEHYSPNGSGTLVAVPPADSDYTESCRLIRVDGFWRTAADTYSRQFGLLKTQAVASVPAKTGVPSDDASAAYQSFVKDFLGQYTGEVATAPTTPHTADFLFNQEARGLNNLLSIAINRPAPADERYLHGRGLYVDYLEKGALDKIKAVVQRCQGDKAECIMPYLPFATINVTELAFWQPMIGDGDGQSVLRVATGSSLIFSPLQPTRGRTNALSSASDGATADAVAKIGRSNAGIAAVRGVDLDDEASNGVDRQVFVVGGTTPPGTGDKFSVRLAGLPQILDTNTQNDPAIAWAVGITDAGDCDPTVSATDPNPNDYACITYGSLGSGVSGSITLANYFSATTVATDSTDLFTQCHLNGVLTTVEPSTVQVPALENYFVSSATINGVDAPPLPAAEDGTRSETTTISFTDIPVDALVTVTFAPQTTYPESPILAEFVSCTATQANGNRKPVLLNTIVWDYSAWE